MNFPKYERYKDSGVEWLGEIPASWDVALGRTCFQKQEIKNKGSVEKTVLSLSYGKIVIKPHEKLHGLVPESFETYQIVHPGNIIIRSTDLQNDTTSLRVGLVKNKGIITSAYLCLATTKQIDSEYAYYTLHALDLLKIYYGMGSGLRQNLNFTDFKYLKLPLPPIAEQERIAEFLDRKCGEIDEAIAKKQRLIELLDEQKTILINQAVTKGLNPDAPMKDSGIDWLGQIPAHWELKKAKHLFKNIIDTEHKTAPSFHDGSYLIVRTSNIKNGGLTIEKALYTNEDTYKRWTQRAAPRAGDILFTREAPAGEACVLPENLKALIGQRVVLMQSNPLVLDSDFAVFSIYGGAAKKYISDLSVGSTVPHFNMSDIKNIPFLTPSIDEQMQIKEYLKSVTDRFNYLKDTENQSVSQLNELKQILIAEAVTGKIKV